MQDSMKSLLSYIVAYYLRHFDEVSCQLVDLYLEPEHEHEFISVFPTHISLLWND